MLLPILPPQLTLIPLLYSHRLSEIPPADSPVTVALMRLGVVGGGERDVGLSGGSA